MNAHFARLVVVPAELGAIPMLLAKITLLLAAAWLVQAALGRLNPRWRVLVWRVTGSAIVLLCVLAISPPFVRLAILPGPTPELAAGDAANPATSLEDRAELRDPNRRIPAASDATATEAEQLTDPDGADGTPRLARPRTAHADRTLAAPCAVDAMPEKQPAFSDDKPAGVAWRPSAFWLLALWCAGAGLCAFMTIIGLLRLRAIRASAGLVPDWVQCESARVASAMGIARRFELRQTQSLQTPCLVGVLGPMILLPTRQCESQYSDELPAILAHELAHLKGGDLFWNAWLNALAIGLWFHPLAWRMRLAHADACDAVCDALASDYVGDAGIYGRTLARLTLRITEAGAAPGLAMARVSSVERRIAAVRRHVFRTGLSRRCAALTVSIATAAIAVLGGLAFVPSQAEPPKAAPPKAAAAQVQPSPAPTKPQESPTIGSAATQGVNEAQPAAKSRDACAKSSPPGRRGRNASSRSTLPGISASLCPRAMSFRIVRLRGLAGVDKGNVTLDKDNDVEFTVPQSEWSSEGLDRLRSDFTEFRLQRGRGLERDWTFPYYPGGQRELPLACAQHARRGAEDRHLAQGPGQASVRYVELRGLPLRGSRDRFDSAAPGTAPLEYRFQLVAGELPGPRRGHAPRQCALHRTPDGQSGSFRAVLGRPAARLTALCVGSDDNANWLPSMSPSTCNKVLTTNGCQSGGRGDLRRAPAGGRHHSRRR